MANLIRLKRASGSDPAASDLVSGEPAVRTDTGELFFKKDDGSVAKVSGAGGGPDFKYLALRNAANNGAASYPNADFTLVTSGTTNALTPTAANTLLVSVNGVIQKPNTGTSTPSSGFALSGSTIKFGGNISAAPDFILYQESGGIGEPSDATVSEAKLQVSNSPVNGYFLSAQSGNTGGLTWAAPVATSCTGNSATATALATARAINGVNFDGTAAITVTAAAGTLSGNTLNSSVTASSLTSLGDLAGLTVDGDLVVDTSTLKVDSSNNRVGIGTASPARDLSLHSGDASSIFAHFTNTDTGTTASDGCIIGLGASEDLVLNNQETGKNIIFESGGSERLRITSDGNLQIPANNKRLQIGANQELEIFRSDNHSSILDNLGSSILAIGSHRVNIVNGGNTEVMASFHDNGAAELYYDNVKKFETVTGGANVTGALGINTTTPACTIDARAASGATIIARNTGTAASIAMSVGSTTNQLVSRGANSSTARDMIFMQGSTTTTRLDSNGHFRPETDSTFDLGTNAIRWRNFYADTLYGDGSNLTGVSAGATGGGSDEVFYENSTTVTTSYSITSNKNAMSAGPLSINSGAVVTVPSGSVWTIV